MVYDIIEKCNEFVWSIPALFLTIFVGMYFTIKTGFLQFRCLPTALKALWRKIIHRKEESSEGSYKALCTALGATVGTGNIAGVAGAISLGGPGVLFWMWISGFLGMIIKFAEASLSVKYSLIKDEERIGGPMYYMKNGLEGRFAGLAALYSFFGVVAAFGVGNATQINAMISSMESAAEAIHFNLPTNWNIWIGAILAASVFIMFIGGAGRIGKLAQTLVPISSLMYVILGLIVILLNITDLHPVLQSIFRGAFQPEAVTGGVAVCVLGTIRTGVSRGVFTNEAGMGTAGIAHASAGASEPCQQGMMGIVEVFLDTIVICTITGLVILCSGIPIPYGTMTDSALTSMAFSSKLGPWSSVFLAGAMLCFAYATIMGWGLYGQRCAQYLLGTMSWRLFAVVQAAVVFFGAVFEAKLIWVLAELFNGLMAIPNLTALILLRKNVISMTGSFSDTLSRNNRKI